MKLSHVVVGLSAISFFDCTYAHPGMKNTLREIQDRIRILERRTPHKQSLHRRLPQANDVELETVTPPEVEEPDDAEPDDPNDDGSQPPVLIGDLAKPPPEGLSPIGKIIANILLQKESGEDSTSTYKVPGALNTAQCKADVCCKWAHVSKQLTSKFSGPSGRCNRWARAAVRLGFHDAGTWEEGLDFGGADGSIVLAKEEMKRSENNGLGDIVQFMPEIAKKYGVGMADLIQFAAKHAVVSESL